MGAFLRSSSEQRLFICGCHVKASVEGSISEPVWRFQFFYCGCKGEGCMGYRGASPCNLAAKTLWLSSVAQPLWHMSSYVKPRCQSKPLEIWLKLTHTPELWIHSPVSMNVCVITPHSGPYPFVSVCSQVLPHINSRNKAPFLPQLSQKFTCIQASVNLVTLLKMEGLKEDWAAFGLFYFNMVHFMLCLVQFLKKKSQPNKQIPGVDLLSLPLLYPSLSGWGPWCSLSVPRRKMCRLSSQFCPVLVVWPYVVYASLWTSTS